MSKVFDFETGKKIGDDKIAKLVEAKTDEKPIPKKEKEETWHGVGEIAEKIIADLEKDREKKEE